jgi:2-amino-4-hydroxy-6-hydroxymethyldihydropteridine diphosphokinase
MKEPFDAADLDRIHIEDLFLRAIIGINEEERDKRQDVLINITLFADTRPAGASDDIDDAVNYRTLTKRVIRMVEASRFYLVERMAAEIAAICLTDPQVAAARVRVEKPGALRFARSVGVEILRTRADLDKRPNRAFIAMGSNVDAEEHLREAVWRLAEHCTLVEVSPVYETAPAGDEEAPDFLNAVAVVETTRSAASLRRDVLRSIEAALGRERPTETHYIIDLDLILFNDEILDLEGRHVPDPAILAQTHLAVPLADLIPERRHPETGQTFREIAQSIPLKGITRRPDLSL